MKISKALTKHNPFPPSMKAIAAYTVLGVPAAAMGVYTANRVNQSTTKGKLAIAGAGIGTLFITALILESLAKLR